MATTLPARWWRDYGREVAAYDGGALAELASRALVVDASARSAWFSLWTCSDGGHCVGDSGGCHRCGRAKSAQ